MCPTAKNNQKLFLPELFCYRRQLSQHVGALWETNQVINVYHLIVQGQACEAMGKDGFHILCDFFMLTEMAGTLVQKAEGKNHS